MHLIRLTNIILAISLCFSFSAFAEKKKKIPTPAPKTSVAPVLKNPIWSEEPTSFIDIQLGKPLTSSVESKCPEGFRRELGSRCYREIDDDRFVIESIGVSNFEQNAVIRTDTGLADGDVEHISLAFNTKRISDILDMFTKKYGPPHSAIVKKLETVGGQELNNPVYDWEGANVVIHIESISVRSYEKSIRSVIETGTAFIVTKNYINKQNEKQQREAAESASKL